MYPKIELHVHLEAIVQAETLLGIAKRNDVPLPAATVEEVRKLFRYRDFDHFMEVWTLTTNALRHYDDFRRVVVDYAHEAARHGAVYIEGSFHRSNGSGGASTGTRSLPAIPTVHRRHVSVMVSRSD